MSDCYVIKPLSINGSNALTSVVEDDYDQWSSSTAYVIGDMVIVLETHKIYEAMVASTNRYPPDWLYNAEDETGRWREVGYTNAWKFSDGRSRVSTVDEDAIEISVELGVWVDCLALLNVHGSIINVEMTDPVEGLVFSEEIETVDLRRRTDFYHWFFSVPERRTDFVLSRLPKYANATITVSITDPGASVEIGELIIGSREHIGTLCFGVTFGIRDYSTKKTDDEGYPEVQEGVYQDEVKFPLMLEAGSIYAIRNLLAAYRATPLVWVGDDMSPETFIYGTYDDLLIVAQSYDYEIANLSIWELS